MFINGELMRKASAGIKTVFNDAFKNAEPKWQLFATEVKSESDREVHGWLGRIPGLRKWIDERQIQNISEHEYEIVNDTYESTIGLRVNDVNDKKIGHYGPIVKGMAKQAKLLPDQLVFSLMKEGFTKKCYDGKPFYSTEHKVGKNKYSNKSTKKLTHESYGAARVSMMSIVVDEESGDVLEVIPTVLAVAAKNEGKAKSIVDNPKLPNGEANPYYKTATVVVLPTLATCPDAWFLFDTTQVIMPFIYQNREEPRFDSLVSLTNDHVFMNDEMLHGVKARAAAGYGFWQMAYGSTGKDA
jgi:phage major head subunit gpT-like protein